MATRDLYDASDEQSAKKSLDRAAKEDGRGRYRSDVKLTLRYMQEEQLADVESELGARYKERQSIRNGSEIIAQTLPLTQRYIDEAATLYNRSVTRELVDENGEKNEATERATGELHRMLGDANFDARMQAVDSHVAALRSCCVWFQARAGKLRAQMVTPDNVLPIEPEEKSWFDPSDQADYRGASVQVVGNGAESSFTFVEPAQVGFYKGSSFDVVNGGFDWRENPYTWPQTVDTDDMRGDELMLPLQMLTYWPRDMASNDIMPTGDASIARANRELNIQWSVLLDTLRLQGWGQLVLNLTNPLNPPQNFISGTRTALPMALDESASMMTSAVNYTDLVGVLGQFVRILAISLRQSPNDFSVEGQRALSGFAKLIDSLPKLEARSDRAAMLAQQERDIAWPRLAVIGKHLGYFSDSIEKLSKLRLRTSFADVDMPLSVPEQVQREAHDVAHGITTPAEILSKREGISLEEAQARVNENLGITEDDGEQTASAGVDDVQKTALNGAQVASMVSTVQAVADGLLPRDSGVAILRIGFQLSTEEAEQVIASAGAGFEPKPKDAPAAPSAPSQETQTEPQRSRRGGLAGLIGRARGGGDG